MANKDDAKPVPAPVGTNAIGGDALKAVEDGDITKLLEFIEKLDGKAKQEFVTEAAKLLIQRRNFTGDIISDTSVYRSLPVFQV